MMNNDEQRSLGSGPNARSVPHEIVPGELHRDLTQVIIGVFYQVYNELGQGFLESVYERAMVILLEEFELLVERQKPISVYFRNRRVGDFRIDLLVERSVALELKVCRSLDPVHEAQLLNYLRATDLEVGLVLNFGEKPEVRRLVLTSDRKRGPVRD